MADAIIFGADVTHPKSETSTIPSVAAVSIIQFNTIPLVYSSEF